MRGSLLAPKTPFPFPFKRLPRRLQTRELPLCSEALYGQHELINPADDSKIDIDKYQCRSNNTQSNYERMEKNTKNLVWAIREE